MAIVDTGVHFVSRPARADSGDARAGAGFPELLGGREPMLRDIVIVGGGPGGLTVAALLRDRLPAETITLIEPKDVHDYQSGWTLVGAGLADPSTTRRPQRDCIPSGVEWLQRRATHFDPDRNLVHLDRGRPLRYRHLVVALGLSLHWHLIEGLEEALGRAGVTSNYRGDLAPYTGSCIDAFRGGRALFTRPALPIKCASAAQNVMYLAADHWQRRGIAADLGYHTAGSVLHSVPYYDQALARVVGYYGIDVHRERRLITVDAGRREVTFESLASGRSERIVEGFDLLHVTPPQGPPEALRLSRLADARGWLDLDAATLRHRRYDNVFGLGDCTALPNVKSVSAVRAQAPVVVRNLRAALDGAPLPARYDGYGACPLVTSRGKVMLAESAYNGVVTPSFDLDPRVPRRRYWWLKRYYLPRLYWRMLGGDLGVDWHAPRKVRGSLPEFVP